MNLEHLNLCKLHIHTKRRHGGTLDYNSVHPPRKGRVKADLI